MEAAAIGHSIRVSVTIAQHIDIKGFHDAMAKCIANNHRGWAKANELKLAVVSPSLVKLLASLDDMQCKTHRESYVVQHASKKDVYKCFCTLEIEFTNLNALGKFVSIYFTSKDNNKIGINWFSNLEGLTKEHSMWPEKWAAALAASKTK